MMFLPAIGNPISALLHHRLRPQRGEVVAIQSDVQRADRHRRLFDPCDHLPQALRQRHPAPADAHQSEVVGAIVFLDDFVDQPNQGALNFRG